MGTLIPTKELCQRSGLKRHQLYWRWHMHPDKIVPSRRLGRALLWDETLVAILLAIPDGRKVSRNTCY